MVLLIPVLAGGGGSAGSADKLTPNHAASPIHYDSADLPEVTSLDVYVAGSSLHLLLAGNSPQADHSPQVSHSPQTGTSVLYYTRSDDGVRSWTPAVRVDTQGLPAPHNPHPGHEPQLAASGEHLVATWQTAGSGWGNSGPLATAMSSDGGKSWRPGPNPADDGSTKGHGFIDITVDRSGRFHLIWLDSRSGKQALYYAQSPDNGAHWSPNVTLDAATCECCGNTMTTFADHLYVLYRDVQPRDMALMGSSDQGAMWQKRGPVGRFNWDFDGCPHTGGGLAVVPEHGAHHPANGALHAVVWTGQSEHAGLHHLASSDGGAHWSPPQRLGDGWAQHADLAALNAERLGAVWDTSGQEAGIFASLSHDGGRTWTTPYRLSALDARASHPRIVATASGYRAFWTEQGPRGRVWATVGLNN